MATVSSRSEATDPSVWSRYRGCLLGGAVGDALGAPIEFLSRSEIVSKFDARDIRNYLPAYGRIGGITDDTQMALFTAEGLLRSHVSACFKRTPTDVIGITTCAYLRWLETQGYKHPLLDDMPQGWLMSHKELFQDRAPGSTCIKALRSLQNIHDRPYNDSKGCGSVMRMAPVGLFGGHWMDQDDMRALTFQLGVDLAARTHGHPTAQLSAGALAVLVAFLTRGYALETALNEVKHQLRKYPAHEETFVAIDRSIELARNAPKAPDVIPEELGEGWLAEEALAIGLYCAASTNDFSSGVILAVNHDGDSDSTGAIAGNILGSMYGVEAIPEAWLGPLELRDVIEEMADDLAALPVWKWNENIDPAIAEHYSSRYPVN